MKKPGKISVVGNDPNLYYFVKECDYGHNCNASMEEMAAVILNPLFPRDKLFRILKREHNPFRRFLYGLLTKLAPDLSVKVSKSYPLHREGGRGTIK